MKTADAIAHYGSAAKLAAALDIFPAAVYQWGEDVPRLRAYQIEVRTGGLLRAEDQPQPEPTP